MNNRKSIFESVHFLNEGIGIGFLVALSLPFIFSTVVLGSITITNKIDQSKIKKGLNNFAKENLPKNFTKNITVKGVQPSQLIDIAGGNEEDIKILKYNNCICLTLEENDNIIAYCVYDTNNFQYKYNIINSKYKNDKNIDLYIRALFEYKIGRYGDALKSIVKKLNFSHTPFFSSSKEAEQGKRVLTKDEEKEIQKQSSDLISKLQAFVKSNVQKCRVEQGLYPSTSSIKSIRIYPTDIDIPDYVDDKYSEILESDKFKKFVEDGKKAFIKFAKNNGFELKGDNRAFDSDKYGYLNLYYKSPYSEDGESIPVIVIEPNF